MALHDEYIKFWRLALQGYKEMYSDVKPAAPGQLADVGRVLPNGSTKEAYPGELDFITRTVTSIAAGDAAVFYFDNQDMGDKSLNPIMETACEFYREGVLRAPFKKVLFLFRYSKEQITKLVFAEQLPDGGGYAVTCFISEHPVLQGRKDAILPAATVEIAWDLIGEFTGDKLFTRVQETHCLFAPSDSSPDDMKMLVGEAVLYFFTGCMLLNMPQYQKDKTEIESGLMKARLKSGKPPLQGYTTVRLRKDIRDHFDKENNGGGWTVKPHWRRGHIRHYRDDSGVILKSIPVQPCMVNFNDNDGELAKQIYKVK